jgi:undecaprenyl diphosphate synthase
MSVDAAAVQACIHAAGLRPERMPRHVAIIMDGNGRWARRRGWLRWRGHRQGVESVRTVITESSNLGIEQLTLYSFSSENWRRPADEVGFLMRLLADSLIQELPTFQSHQVQLGGIGRLDRLPADVRRTLDRVRSETANNQGLHVDLALSYGGRDELVDACRHLAQQVAAGELDPAAIDGEQFAGALYRPEAGDVDLVIRTAGELRLSNFLPWQSVYAEFVVLPEFWPELTVTSYHQALQEYQRRNRRFGGVVCR